MHLTRLAPTPSGYLHIGNAIGMLLTRRIAKESGARILLRIDDLDSDRVRPEYLDDIFESLKWLGVAWDLGPKDVDDHRRNWSQSLRIDRYFQLLERLRALNVLYGCTCTRAQLRGSDIYPGTCRDKKISLDDPTAAWRIAVPEGAQAEVNLIAGGTITIDVSEVIGDVVLRQRPIGGKPAMPAYQIASLSDDVESGTTLIVRGADLLPSTAIQMHLAQLLDLDGFRSARYLHHPLVLDPGGRKLSKSEGAFSLKAMRERGADPSSIIDQADRMYAQCFP